MHRRMTVLAAGVTLCVAGGSAVVVGFAAGLGGINSGALDSWSESMTANAPAVVTCDNFEGADAAMSGRAVETSARCGAFAWTLDVGSWSVAGGLATSDGTSDAVATLPVGLIDVSVGVALTGVDTGSHAAGVVVAHDGAASYLAAVVVGDPQVRVDLVLMAGGVATVLSTADVTIGPTTNIVLSRDGAEVDVLVDGVPVVAHTLDAGVIAVLGTGDRAGLYASSASVQFDNLRVTTPLA
jgi:hypothetical protein